MTGPRSRRAAWSGVLIDGGYSNDHDRIQRAGHCLAAHGDRVLLDNFHAAPAQVQAGIKTTLGAFSAAGAGKARKPKAA